MQRLPLWQQNLTALFAQHEHTKFAWGTHDCYTFACAAVHAQTGQHVAVTQQYATQDDAIKEIARIGGDDYLAAVAAVLGPPVRGALAQRGDIVLMRTPGVIGYALGVHAGSAIAFPGPDGLTFMRVVATRIYAFSISNIPPQE